MNNQEFNGLPGQSPYARNHYPYQNHLEDPFGANEYGSGHNNQYNQHRAVPMAPYGQQYLGHNNINAWDNQYNQHQYMGMHGPVQQALSFGEYAHAGHNNHSEFLDEEPVLQQDDYGRQLVHSGNNSSASDFHPNQSLPQNEIKVEEEDQEEDQEEEEDEERLSPDRQSGRRVKPNSPLQFPGHIKSEKDYHKREALRLSAQVEARKQIPVDCPTDPKEQQKLVKQLFDAIVNTHQIMDKPCKGGKPAQAVKRIQEGYYPAEAIEMACWNILLRTKWKSQGVNLIEVHHKGVKREDNKSHYPTFSYRFNEVVNTLRDSKAACKQVLDTHFIDRLVEAPHGEKKMKENNKKINTERDKQNEIGRKAFSAGYTTESFVEGGTPVPVQRNPGDLRALSKAVGDQKFDYPAVATPSPRKRTKKVIPAPKRSTGKRKARGFEDDEDEEDEEESEVSDVEEEDQSDSGSESDFATSARKSTAKRHASARRMGAQALETPTKPKSRAKAMKTPRTPARQSTRAAAGAATKRMAQITNDMNAASDSLSPASSSRSQQKSVGNRALSPLPANMDLEMRYKVAICDILGVNRDFANQLTLRDLRTYARGFNRQFEDHEWYLAELPWAVGRGPLLCNEDRSTVLHVGHFFKQLRELAVARGDLVAGKFTTINETPDISTNGDPELDAALGVIENEFGYHPNLWNLREAQ